MLHASEEYRSALSARESTLEKLERDDIRLANLRTVVFVAGITMAAIVWALHLFSPAWLALPVLLFGGLVIRHDRLDQTRDRVKRATAYYQRALRRLTSEWHGEGIVRSDLVDEEHPYSADLDVFGVGSLFDLMATTRTPAGIHRLAEWLARASDPDTIRKRQSAVVELRERVQLREDLALLADGVAAHVHPETLSHWAERDPFFVRLKRAKLVAWLVTVLAIVGVVAWPLTSLGPIPLIGVAVLAALIRRRFRDALDGVIGTIENPQRELRVLAQVLARLEQEPSKSGALNQQLECIRGSSRAIKTLISYVTWLDAMRNQFFYPLGFVTMWPLHFSCAIESWRMTHGKRVRGWLDALGDLEALAAMGGFAFENPTFTFPDITEGSAQFRAKALGHPLLPDNSVVKNDIELGKEPRVLLVSGSNMSGKSTMLRTIGLNTVLALAGAPVRAQELQVSMLNVGASLRTQDSLLGGKSRFYAEIVRLKQILDLAHGEYPVLFLLDEILHGTNSHDRRLGARAILGGFLKTDAIGLVTTHDLALADAAKDLVPQVRNVHFADDLVDGSLEFDYQLRDGIVQRSNAIALMRSVGLRV